MFDLREILGNIFRGTETGYVPGHASKLNSGPISHLLMADITAHVLDFVLNDFRLAGLLYIDILSLPSGREPFIGLQL